MHLISPSDDAPRGDRGCDKRGARWPHRWLWPVHRLARTGRSYRDLAVETHDSHWRVMMVFRADGGGDQALLRSVRDPSVQRTLALRVLDDPQRFRRVA